MSRIHVDSEVFQLAEHMLGKAPKVWIESLAERLQRECDDSRSEYEDWCEEQRSLRTLGLSGEEKARI